MSERSRTPWGGLALAALALLLLAGAFHLLGL
jgi:hypothetical protein